MRERPHDRGGPGTDEITFEGRPIPVRPGQSIGAALVAAGIRSWRVTRVNERPRGLFCGIGVCFDCLVTVNGRPSLRACLVEARPGDVVGPAFDPAADPAGDVPVQGERGQGERGQAGGRDDA